MSNKVKSTLIIGKNLAKGKIEVKIEPKNNNNNKFKIPPTRFPPCITESKDGVRISINAKPGAKQSRVTSTNL